MFTVEQATADLVKEAELHKASEIFRAINHDLRLNILKTLYQKNQLTVTELYTLLNIDQSCASQNLSVLREAGLVITRRDGKFVYYSVQESQIKKVENIAGKLLQ